MSGSHGKALCFLCPLPRGRPVCGSLTPSGSGHVVRGPTLPLRGKQAEVEMPSAGHWPQGREGGAQIRVDTEEVVPGHPPDGETEAQKG